MSTLTARIQLRIDTAANWTTNNPVLLLGEMGLEQDTGKSKVGNGTANWNTLPYITQWGESATPLLRTGATIAFDAPAIYNTPTAPSSGTVTLDLSGAVAGTEVVACFNHASEPSWPSGVSAVGTWNNSALNVVRFTYIDSSNIVAVIVSDAATSSTTNGGWPRVDKTTTEQRNNTTTLTADTDLQVPMVANGKYYIKGTLWGGVAGSGPGLKYGFTGPASPTLVRATGEHGSSIATPPADYTQSTYETTGKVFPSSGAGLHKIKVEFYIENGANAGNFQITWAQNASNATFTNMGRGSYLEYIRIA